MSVKYRTIKCLFISNKTDRFVTRILFDCTRDQAEYVCRVSASFFDLTFCCVLYCQTY